MTMVMYRDNLSLRTFLTFFFSFENFRIFEFVRILVGFNRIKSIVILLKDRNQNSNFLQNVSRLGLFCCFALNFRTLTFELFGVL